MPMAAWRECGGWSSEHCRPRSAAVNRGRCASWEPWRVRRGGVELLNGPLRELAGSAGIPEPDHDIAEAFPLDGRSLSIDLAACVDLAPRGLERRNDDGDL